MRFFSYPVSRREYRGQETSQGHPGTGFEENPRPDASADAPESAQEQVRRIKKCPAPQIPSTMTFYDKRRGVPSVLPNRAAVLLSEL